ncbi:MAG: hypothetical protein Q7S28_02510 [bacterium]|nr:hypothetical protein [bacterium]
MAIERSAKFTPTPEEQEKMRKEIEAAAEQKGRMPELIKDEASDILKKTNARLIDEMGDKMIEETGRAILEDEHLADKVFDEVEGKDKDI